MAAEAKREVDVHSEVSPLPPDPLERFYTGGTGHTAIIEVVSWRPIH